jgi:hypothetical protein
MDKPASEHDVHFDQVGANHRPRYSCHTCGGRPVVQQPFMSADEWKKERDSFLEKHPCIKVKGEGDTEKNLREKEGL